MEYTTYWSILDAPSHTTKSNSICLIVAVGFAILWLLTKKFKKNNGDGEKLILLWGTGLFAVLGLVMYFFLTYSYKDNSDAEIAARLNSSTAPKIEGVVSNFQRTYRKTTKYSKETIESFTVDSLQFAYGDALMAQFNSFSETNNNVIHDGQFVRITYGIDSYYGEEFNTIIKLEIGH